MDVAGPVVRDQHASQRLAEPYRRGLQLNGYRMLGSRQDARPPAGPPAPRYEMREAVQLLRGVLGWSAPETAGLIGASLTSVNCALQRARATMAERFPTGRPGAQGPPAGDRERTLLRRYVWEEADLAGFVSLPREGEPATLAAFGLHAERSA